MTGYTDVCERMVWLPKSCVAIKDGCVWVKNWIAKKNAIGVYGARSYVVG